MAGDGWIPEAATPHSLFSLQLDEEECVAPLNESFLALLSAKIDAYKVIKEDTLPSLFSQMQVKALRTSYRELLSLHRLTTSSLVKASASSQPLFEQLHEITRTARHFTSSLEKLYSQKVQIEFSAAVVRQLAELTAAVETISDCIETSTDVETAARLVGQNRAHIPTTEEHIEPADTPFDARKFETKIATLLDGSKNCSTVSLLRTSEGKTVLEQLDLFPALRDAIAAFRQYEKPLSTLLRKRFEHAIAANDQDSVARHAKLFQPLGLPSEAMTKFMEFIRYQISERCASSFKPLRNARKDAPALHPDVLTKVFITIADVIQEHQESVSQTFGNSDLVVFYRGLQAEADIQAIRLIDLYYDDRFRKYVTNPEDNHSNLRELDQSLDEVTLLSQRCQQFDKYIRSNCSKVFSALPVSAVQDLNSRPTATEGTQLFSDSDGLLVLSGLSKRMQEVLGLYVTLEERFIARSLRLAITATDEVAWDDPEQLTSTCVEDAFFILHKSVTRAIAGSDIFAACAVVNHVVTLLSTELKTQLEAGLQSARDIYSGYIQGRADWIEYSPAKALAEAESNEPFPEGPKGSAYSWTHSVNNLQACTEYIDQFHSKCELEFDDRFADPPDETQQESPHYRHEAAADTGKLMFQHTLQNIQGVRSEFEASHLHACKMTLNILKGHLGESLKPLDSANYHLSEDDFFDAQVNDPYIINFIEALRGITDHLVQFFNPHSSNACIQLLTERACKRIEASVRRKAAFTLLGAVQFDTEVRALMTFFSEISSQSIRSKFGRLMEMGDLLNLSVLEEFDDIGGGVTHKTWRLAPDEIRQTLCLRTDFNDADVVALLSSRGVLQ